MPRNERQVIAVVVAVVLFGGVVLLRHALRAPEPEVQPVVPARIPPRDRTVGRLGSSSHSLESADGFDTVEPSAPIVASDQVASGSVPTALKPAKPVPAGVLRGRVPAAVNEPQVGAANQTGSADSGTPPPVPGAALSVNFNGSTNGSGDQATPLYDQGIEFDATAGAARFPPNALLAYPDAGGLNPEEGTVAFWIRMEWDPSTPLTKSLVELVTNTWANRFEIGMGPTFIRLLLTNSDGIEQGVGAGIHWMPGEWHHFAASWGEQLMSLYIDAALLDQKPYTGSVVIPPDTPLFVGSSKRGPSETGPENQGTVSLQSLSIFQRVLSADEIAMLASSAPPAQ